MRDSVIYQDILQEGRQEGLQEGRQEGLQEGRQEEAINLILRQLERRLMGLDETTRSRIMGLSLPQLEALGEALLDFVEVADLDQWLAGHSE